MKPEDVTLIEQYARIMETRQAPIGRESDLPAPKQKIREVLLRAQGDPIYALGKQALDIGLKMLDTFVAEADYEEAHTLLSRAWEAAKRGDAETFAHTLRQANEPQRRAIVAATDMAVNGAILKSQHQQRDEESSK